MLIIQLLMLIVTGILKLDSNCRFVHFNLRKTLLVSFNHLDISAPIDVKIDRKIF